MARPVPVVLPPRSARILCQLAVTGYPKQVVIDSGMALVACMDGALDIIDLERCVRTASVPLPGMPVDVLVHHGMGIALVSSMQARPDRLGRVCKVDLRRGGLVSVTDLTVGWAKGMTIRPGTSELWVTTWLAGGIEVIDIETMRTRARLRLGAAPRGIAFEGSGDACFVTDYYGRTVVHVDAVRLEVVGIAHCSSRAGAVSIDDLDLLAEGAVTAFGKLRDLRCCGAERDGRTSARLTGPNTGRRLRQSI